MGKRHEDAIIADQCPQLVQGIMFCALCFKTKKRSTREILEEWVYCCNKPMNLLPVHGIKQPIRIYIRSI